jgi:hypothetical protein
MAVDIAVGPSKGKNTRVDKFDDATQTACYGVGAWQGIKTAEQVKLLITLPDGKMVTVYAPRGVVINCNKETNGPQPQYLYLGNETRLA